MTRLASATASALALVLFAPSAVRAQTAAQIPDPCPAERLATPGAPWRLVRGEGFTFCLPVGWQPAGPGERGLDPAEWSFGVLKLDSGRGRTRTNNRRESGTVTRNVSVAELTQMRDEVQLDRTTYSSETVAGTRVAITTSRHVRSGESWIVAEWGGAHRGHLVFSGAQDSHQAVITEIVRTVRPADPS